LLLIAFAYVLANGSAQQIVCQSESKYKKVIRLIPEKGTSTKAGPKPADTPAELSVTHYPNAPRASRGIFGQCVRWVT
jgi:hypothetical protein